MNKDDLNEKIHDQVFKYIAQQRMDEISNDYPSDDVLAKNIEFSPKFEKEMSAYFIKLNRKEKNKRRRRVLVKVAAIIVVFLFISIAIIYNVEALRVPVLNFINNIGQKSTTINLVDANADYNSIIDQIHGLYLPIYLPDSYKVKSIDNSDSFYTVIFENENAKDVIIFNHLSEGTTVTVDSENAQVEQIQLNGGVAQIYSKEGHITFVFSYNNNDFMIQGYISKQDIMKMAQSLKFFK